MAARHASTKQIMMSVPALIGVVMISNHHLHPLGDRHRLRR